MRWNRARQKETPDYSSLVAPEPNYWQARQRVSRACPMRISLAHTRPYPNNSKQLHASRRRHAQIPRGANVKVCPSCGNTYDDDMSFCPNEGIVLVPVSDGQHGERDLIGERLFGDYVLRKKLGEGGMGSVYLAENAAINQKIAVKVLHPEAAASDETLQRFNREACAIARLTHPNTIRVFIFGKTEEPLIYLAMEFVNGISLRDAMHEQGPFDEL